MSPRAPLRSRLRRVVLPTAIVLACVAIVLLAFALRPSLVVLAPVALALGMLPGGLSHLVRRHGARRTAGRAMVAGSVIAVAVAVASWHLAHPLVHIDNPSGTPMQLWLDGERWTTLDGATPDGEPLALRVPWGRHIVGRSSLDADAPEAVDDVFVPSFPLGRTLLYDPGESGCYWLEVKAYGDASIHGHPHGPLRVRPLYQLDDVDVWFGAAPKDVETPIFSTGITRTALQRHQMCMELATSGCDAEARDAFVACQRSPRPPGEMVDCFQEAQASCSGD